MSHDSSNGHYTRTLARFVSGLAYDQIPADVMQRIKLLILDALGCGVFGADLQWSRILQRRLAEIDTTPACTVWGTRRKLSSPHAALVNGTQVQGFELDDVHHLGVLHTGAVVLPPLIAIAETRRGLSGKEFLAAAVAGYEVGPRVGICMGNEHIAQGWHSGATAGVFAAAAGAARALKLDHDAAVHALGIAGTQAAGLMAAQYGAMVKRMHAGRAAQSGLYAAELAAGGFTGIVNVFESEYGGFCTTFSRSTDRFRLDELVAGLESVWQTMGVRLKFYSCVGSNHTTLDVMRELRSTRPFAASEVDKIVIHAAQATVEHAGWKYVPQGLTSAQMNLSYCVATMLLDGECFVDQFTDDKLTDPARMALADKVAVVHDPAITAQGPQFRQSVRVEVYLKDGARMDGSRVVSRHKQTFASDAEVVRKFETLAAHVLPRARVGELRDLVLDLERCADVARIAELLAAPA